MDTRLGTPAGALCIVEPRLTSTSSAIDCDVHPAAPTMPALLPFLEEFWRNSVVERGIPSLETNIYPARAPLSARPQWRGAAAAPGVTPGPPPPPLSPHLPPPTPTLTP